MDSANEININLLPFVNTTKYCSPRVDRDGETPISFLNLTTSNIQVLWHSFNGSLQAYGTLRPGGQLHLNTFVGHIWSFIEEDTGDHVVDENNNYYHITQRQPAESLSATTPSGGYNSAPTFSIVTSSSSSPQHIVKIRTPLLNLKELCLKWIRNELVFRNNMGLYSMLDNLPASIVHEVRIIWLSCVKYIESLGSVREH